MGETEGSTCVHGCRWGSSLHSQVNVHAMRGHSEGCQSMYPARSCACQVVLVCRAEPDKMKLGRAHLTHNGRRGAGAWLALGGLRQHRVIKAGRSLLHLLDQLSHVLNGENSKRDAAWLKDRPQCPTCALTYSEPLLAILILVNNLQFIQAQPNATLQHALLHAQLHAHQG